MTPTLPERLPASVRRGLGRTLRGMVPRRRIALGRRGHIGLGRGGARVHLRPLRLVSLALAPGRRFTPTVHLGRVGRWTLPALGPRIPAGRDLHRLALERTWTCRAAQYSERLPGQIQPRVRFNPRATTAGWFEPESEVIWLSLRSLKRDRGAECDRALRHLVSHQAAWTIEGSTRHDQLFAEFAALLDAPVLPLSYQCVRSNPLKETSR